MREAKHQLSVFKSFLFSILILSIFSSNFRITDLLEVSIMLTPAMQLTICILYKQSFAHRPVSAEDDFEEAWDGEEESKMGVKILVCHTNYFFLCNIFAYNDNYNYFILEKK